VYAVVSLVKIWLKVEEDRHRGAGEPEGYVPSGFFSCLCHSPPFFPRVTCYAVGRMAEVESNLDSFEKFHAMAILKKMISSSLHLF
jgi:hypothetical protein